MDIILIYGKSVLYEWLVSMALPSVATKVVIAVTIGTYTSLGATQIKCTGAIKVLNCILSRAGQVPAIKCIRNFEMAGLEVSNFVSRVQNL